MFWQANATDARGLVIDESLGASIQTIRGYDQVTGRIDFIQSGTGGSSTLQNLNYQWDTAGNLTERQDANQSLTEHFYYDDLHRLDYSTRNGVTNLDLAYNQYGNITSKSGVGTYTYHATRIHAVASINTGSGTLSYSYNANGQMTNRSGTTIAYYHNGLVKQITKDASNSSLMSYTADGRRWANSYITGGSQFTTRYIGDAAGVLYEKVNSGSGTTTEHKHYIRAGRDLIALYVRKAVTPGPVYTNTVYYLLKDSLGSTDVITDAAGAVVVRESFDGFGKRRGTNWTGNPTATELTTMNATTRRGFTFHEHLDSVDLVHMNGRLYDPFVGRFISPDPIIDGSFGTQGFNLYSYVGNRPLSFTDPSGFAGARGGDKMQDAGFDMGDIREARAQAAAVARGQQMVSGPRTSSTNHTTGMQWAQQNVLGGFRGAEGDLVLQPVQRGNTPSPKSNSPVPNISVECDDPSQCVEDKYPGLPRGVKPGEEPGLGQPDAEAFAFVAGGGVKASLQLGSALAAVAVRGFGRFAAKEVGTGAATAANAVTGNGSGVTVLGSFPNYVQMGEKMGANFFNVPAEKWAQMTVAEQWAANRAFLDAAIARGDRFVFSDSFAPAGSFFERELLYLQEQRVFLGVPGL